MNEKLTKLVTIGISTLSSIAFISAVFLILDLENEALKGTTIAMLAASLALEIYPRLVGRSHPQQNTG
jgi:hypothetical protein